MTELFEAQATLSALQREMARHVAERGWTDDTPQDLVLLLVEEVGELAKDVRKVTGMRIDQTASRAADVGAELADTLNLLLALANLLDVDLQRAHRAKMDEIQSREWE